MSIHAMARMASLLLAALASTASASVQAPKISPRPPMGFNNWARFQCNLNETLFTKTADAMVQKGLLAAGYNNMNLDDCWHVQTGRNAKGELEWNSTLFPHGLPWLGSYLHDRGFNFGIYTNAGNMTCGWYPGSQDHELIDAQTFSRWGIDYVKIDGCHMDLQQNRSYYEEFEYRYKLWHSILTTQIPKPLVFSQSAPAYFSPNFHLDKNNTDWYRTMDYIRSTGELARHSDDVKVYGNNPTNTFEPGGHWDSILNNYGMQVRLARYQSCGFYNDPDFIIPDWPDLTLNEKKSHFALWASFSAPLILSAWVPDLTKEEVEYLTNKEIIDVDQDALCAQATLVSQNEDDAIDVLTKPLANGDILLTILNHGANTRTATVALERLGISDEATYTARDLWTGKTSRVRGELKTKLASHATAIYRLSLSGNKKIEQTPTGQIFSTFSLTCLTASRNSVRFAPCAGADEQVWRVSASGAISPLSAPRKCLVADRDGDVELADCGRGAQQTWRYGVDGNVVSRGLGKGRGCLSEGARGRVGVNKCGREVDAQVFGLPWGVRLEE